MIDLKFLLVVRLFVHSLINPIIYEITPISWWATYHSENTKFERLQPHRRLGRIVDFSQCICYSIIIHLRCWITTTCYAQTSQLEPNETFHNKILAFQWYNKVSQLGCRCRLVHNLWHILTNDLTVKYINFFSQILFGDEKVWGYRPRLTNILQ